MKIRKEQAGIEIMFPVLAVFVIAFFLLRGSNISPTTTTTTLPDEFACKSDSECVHRPSCCHIGASPCINTAYARKYVQPCTGVACTMECRTCLECGCANDRCTGTPSYSDGCC